MGGPFVTGPGEWSDESLLTAVRRAVRSVLTSSRSRALYAEAEEALVSNGPEGVLPGLFTHFGKLFDVKRLEGMFPRMNVSAAACVLCVVCVCVVCCVCDCGCLRRSCTCT